ncbi:MAG: ribonuclease HII [Defluviitaleaceae bacterium]|nr:ribonuclease HII [Defluviitaleaceae bacterium]
MAVKTAPDIRERELFAQGIWPVAGVDEAGRGPLAGPVVACAVVLPPGSVIEGVYDSKKINPPRRAELAGKIKSAALAYAFGIIEPREIDRVNILQAAMKAMEDAVYAVQSFLGEPLRYVLVDGNRLPALPCPAEYLIKGDHRCHIIAAASILAKEARDTIMRDIHRLYPQYGFDEHKGYPTSAHFDALKRYGPCPEHRMTFRGVNNSELIVRSKENE